MSTCLSCIVTVVLTWLDEHAMKNASDATRELVVCYCSASSMLVLFIIISLMYTCTCTCALILVPPRIPAGTSQYLADLLLQLLKKQPTERMSYGWSACTTTRVHT